MSSNNTNNTKDCPHCNGTGSRPCTSCGHFGMIVVLPTYMLPCSHCNATGYEICPDCNGSGKVKVSRK